MLPAVTHTELDAFSHGETSQFSIEQKAMSLTQASDLLYFATHYDETPDDARLVRLVKAGIMDMAWSLLVRTENKTEIYSPFSSETIGSYSYSKAMSQVSSGLSTGIDWFDKAVMYLGEAGLSGAPALTWSSSEKVLSTSYFEADAATIPDFYGW
jgi:hypothetical protein